MKVLKLLLQPINCLILRTKVRVKFRGNYLKHEKKHLMLEKLYNFLLVKKLMTTVTEAAI